VVPVDKFINSYTKHVAEVRLSTGRWGFGIPEDALPSLTNVIGSFVIACRRRSSRPLVFTPSASFFRPSRPSHSTNFPVSIPSMLARTRRRMAAACSGVRAIVGVFI
jgi:hypothetical protein